MTSIVRVPRTCFLCFFIFTFFLFYFCFLACFFPARKNVGNVAQQNDIPPHQQNFPPRRPRQALFKRLVFILIDSLRADFLIDNQSSFMTYLSRLLQQGRAIGQYGITQPPTVTLPRIKAMMTGGVPGFIDVVMNFDTKSLQEDNLLSRLYRSGRKMVFYGDDTWVKLFPGYFLRHDATTSFYVNDYTESTFGLGTSAARLGRDDFALFGLDHIGHLSKPSSPLVKPKLREMDDIIKKIHERLIEKNYPDETLMVICGDHGMSDQGSHGGASKKEITVAVVWLSSMLNKKKGHVRLHSSQSSVIDQIDITPTLALAFAVPIPRNNLGTAIPDVLLSHSSVDNAVDAMYLNAQQVISVLKENNPKWKNDGGYNLFESTVQHHIHWLNSNKTDHRLWHQQGLALVKQYHSAVKAMSAKMMTTLTKYDIYGMVLCSATISLLVYGILLILLRMDTATIKLVFSPLSCIITLLLCISFVCFHLTICTSSYCSEVLCKSFLSGGVIITVLMLFITIFIPLVLAFRQSTKSICSDKHISFSGTTLFLALGSLLHCISFMSSSFIEEEHQTWYFLTVSLFIVMMIDCLRKQHFCSRLTSSSSQNLVRLSPNMDSKTVCITISLLLLCRFQRTWNQTGDKWQHLSDIGDWFLRPENKWLLSVVCLLFLKIILISIWIHYKQQIRSCHLLLVVAALIFVYLFHAAAKKLISPPPWIWNISENGLKESRIVYSLTLLLILETCIVIRMKNISNNSDENIYYVTMQSAVSCLKSVSIIISILLTSYPHNMCVLAIATIQEIILRKLLSCINLPVWATALVYTWMAQATYFYQVALWLFQAFQFSSRKTGHSNSLSSIDVTAGYTGVGQYRPFLVSVLLALSTYSGVIFWYSCLINFQLETSLQQHKTQIKNRLLTTYLSLMFSVTLPLPTYTLMVTMQRYHLFVWTVFSPKLLFASMSYLVTSVFVLIVFLLQKICL